MPKIYGNSEIWGDLLVTGSFSILGSASSIYTTSLVVSDTIIGLGHSQSGSPLLDEGIMFSRGSGLTQAFIWDESDDTFALIGTNDDHTVIGDVNIQSYSNLKVSGLEASTIKITNGASSNYILISDATGNASWTASLPGTSGTSGSTGLSGTSGTSAIGSAGTSGTSAIGSAGTSGTSGSAGTSGTSGSAGTSGLLSLSGTTNNGLITLNGSAPNGTVEANLTFDGSILTVNGRADVTTLSASGSSSDDLVRITQTGTGNSFVVEDSTNPDSTPFVIDNSGYVSIGTSSASHLLTLGKGGGLSIYGTSSGYVYIKSKDTVTSWTASLPSTKGSISQFVYNNFGGEIMLNDGEGNLFFGTTPSLYLPTNYVFIGNTWSYAMGRTFSGDMYSDYTGSITINQGVVSYNKIQTLSQKSVLGSTNVSGGVVSEIPLYNTYITIGSASTALENASNWTGATYTGPSITGTYQGQNHYNGSYFYTAVDDNLWIRLARV